MWWISIMQKPSNSGPLLLSGFFCLRSYLLTWAYVIWLVPSGFYYYFRALLGDVQLYWVQWALLSLISEDNHCAMCLCVQIPSAHQSRVSLIIGVALLQCHPHRRSRSTQMISLTAILTTLLSPCDYVTPPHRQILWVGGALCYWLLGALTTWGFGLGGFRCWLQLMHCAYLVMKSKYFIQGQESKSKVNRICGMIEFSVWS